MTEQKFVYVDANYLKELEETAKKVDYYKGIIDGINMVMYRKTEPIEVYNGNADKENWQGITIKPIENEPQTDKDFKVTYTCSFTDCDNFKNFGFSKKCIECKHKQSEIRRETKPQTDIHDLTDCDFCKDRNCKDCEGGKDEPQTKGVNDV